MEKQQSDNGGEVVLEVGKEKSNRPRSSESSASQTITNRNSFSRSVLSIPKSRFGEQLPIMHEETSSVQATAENSGNASSNRESPNEISLERSKSSSAKKAPPSPGRAEDDDEDEEVYKVPDLRVSKKILIEWFVFLCILGCLVASLTMKKLQHCMVWGLEIWKWCVLVMVVFSGMFVTNWVMHLMLFVIEGNFLLRKKVLYFVHGLKKSIQVLMWVSLVLLTWLLLIKRGFQQSQGSSKIVAYITRSIVAGVIGAFLWLLKTLLVLILASKFEAVTYFDRIQESILFQYILQAISGTPFMEEDYERSRGSSKLSYRETKKAQAEGVSRTKIRAEREVSDKSKIQGSNVSSWTLNGLVNVVTSSGLTISLKGHSGKEITSEMEATAAADDIFLHVAPPGAKYIEEWDLMRFMTEEEVDLVWPLIDVAMTGKVDRKTLTDWVLKVYTDRKALAHALSDTKAVTAQVDNLVTSIVFIIIIVVSLLVVEIATTSFFVFLSSQLVLAAFAFGNTCKNVFESIMFLFVAHPYDVGDCIVFDGVPMIVEEMSIFTTVCLKLSSNEKVYYPNSVLSATSISNYTRSPDMREAVEFSIALTPVENIVKLKEKIKEYIEGKPQYWHRKHNVAVINIEDVNKLKMAVYCHHKLNFRDFEENNLRRAELNFELLKILEELNITVMSDVSSPKLNHTPTDKICI
uniref:mechanosensitive ion channel protein 10-like n=1 Tax=Fragaria vesca subsp. vesca TaxID=101020 RepID=UPI0005C8C763|nr:PREDICTED: mechanosensitive ion channel protein 10-like [Fragaria vesca subsp. vesca]